MSYFPLPHGRYEVKPGFRNFGTDFGNGELDQKVFQFAPDAADVLKHKRDLRARLTLSSAEHSAHGTSSDEDIRTYYCASRFDNDLLQATCRLIVERLTLEWPEIFQWASRSDGGRDLLCSESGNRISELSSGQLQVPKTNSDYLDPFDALAAQVPEDLAVWTVLADSKDEYLSAVHLSSPNHWAPADKVGRSFAAVHGPVAGMEKINPFARGLLDSIMKGGPFVRFAWGVATDTSLNHHPNQAAGRSFDPTHPELHLRIERQVLWPIPGQPAFLFTIRTYFRSVPKLSATERHLLADAIRSMTPASLRYKGLEQDRDLILAWINTLK